MHVTRIVFVGITIGFLSLNVQGWPGDTPEPVGDPKESGVGSPGEFETTDAEPSAGRLWVEPKSGIRFRFIPAGTFEMGSPPDEAGRGKDEIRHPVVLTRPFWIGETEITQAQWQSVTGANPSFFAACGGSCPVETVTWLESVIFANLVSEQAGLDPCYAVEGQEVVFSGLDCRGFRLPTEAEWEWSARSGTDSALYTGSLTIAGLANSPELDVIAWYGGNSGVEYDKGYACSDWTETQEPAEFCGTHPVGGKVPNQWGLHDMVGGVWEWVYDMYSPYPTTSVVDPVGGDTGTARVARGCAWDSAAKTCRTANRSANAPFTRYRFTGLRLARTATEPEAESVKVEGREDQ